MAAPSRVCSSCRTPVPTDAAFCVFCGAPTPTGLTREDDTPDALGDHFERRLSAALADRYRLVRELGRGGMAVVYLADDLRHERQVAIKVMRPEIAEAIGADRFVREIKLAAKLNHQHILALYDSGEAEGFLYYVMPFVEGDSLRDRLVRDHQLSVEDALQITREVAEGLDYAHEQGVIHRDIKPENILLSRGHALIVDFGIGRAVAATRGGQLTSTGTSIGTPLYMSPEQAAGDPNLDGRTDVYSLACVLYEMLAGEPPFTGPSRQVIMAKHAMEARPSVRVIRDTVPNAVDRAIQRAMAKVPADRYPTAVAAADALCGGGMGREGWPRRVMRPRTFRAALAVAAVAAVGVVAAVLSSVGGLGPRHAAFYLRAPSAEGLEPGTRVVMAGVEVGVVREVTTEVDAATGVLSFVARLRLMRRFPNGIELKLPRETQAETRRPDSLMPAVVVLVPGAPGSPGVFLRPGDTIPARVAAEGEEPTGDMETPPRIATIQASHRVVRVFVGSLEAVFASAYDSSGRRIHANFEWSSGDGAVARLLVDPDKTALADVQGRGPGVAPLRVAAGGRSVVIRAEVFDTTRPGTPPDPTRAQVVPTRMTLLIGEQDTVFATYYDRNLPSVASFDWIVSNPRVVRLTIDPYSDRGYRAIVEGIAPGEAYVQAYWRSYAAAARVRVVPAR